MDIQIEQYLDLEIQLKRKLKSHSSGILNTDRYVFHLHRLIAAKKLNILTAFWPEDSDLKATSDSLDWPILSIRSL